MVAAAPLTNDVLPLAHVVSHVQTTHAHASEFALCYTCQADGAVAALHCQSLDSSDCDACHNWLDRAVVFSHLTSQHMGRVLLSTPSIPSTQDFMRQHTSVVPDGAVLVADQQTKGKGKSCQLAFLVWVAALTFNSIHLHFQHCSRCPDQPGCSWSVGQHTPHSTATPSHMALWHSNITCCVHCSELMAVQHLTQGQLLVVLGLQDEVATFGPAQPAA